MNDVESNKTLVREHFEEFVNRKNHSVIFKNLAETFVDHNGPDGRVVGRKEDHEMMMGIHAKMPNFRVRIEDMIAEGNKVVCRNVWTGTRPDGVEFLMKGIVIWRIEEGKIVERWATIEG